MEDLRLILLGKTRLPHKVSRLLAVHPHPEAMFNYPRGLIGDHELRLTFTVYGLTFYLSVHAHGIPGWRASHSQP
jgi:hypothetical protein